MTDKATALHSLRPNAEWVLRNDELEWRDVAQTQPSEDELTVEVARLQVEYDNNKYQRDRASAYPSMQDQLDMQYWDGVNGTTTWQDAIATIKTENPKP